MKNLKIGCAVNINAGYDKSRYFKQSYSQYASLKFDYDDRGCTRGIISISVPYDKMRYVELDILKKIFNRTYKSLAEAYHSGWVIAPDVKGVKIVPTTDRLSKIAIGNWPTDAERKQYEIGRAYPINLKDKRRVT